MDINSIINRLQSVSIDNLSESDVKEALEIVLYDDPTNKVNLTIPNTMQFYILYDQDGYNIYSAKQLIQICGSNMWWERFFTKHPYIDRVYRLEGERNISNFLCLVMYKICN